MTGNMKRSLSRIFTMTLCMVMLITSLSIPGLADAQVTSDSMTALDIMPFQDGFDVGPWTVDYYVGEDLYFTETVDDGVQVEGPSANPGDLSGVGFFIGWYLQGAAEPVDLTTMSVKENLTLFARYNDTNGLVRFRDYYGNIIAGKTLTASTVGDIGAGPNGDDANVPGGVTIEYWYDETADDSVNYLSQPPSTPVRGLVTLRPKLSHVHTVSFNTMGGTSVDVQLVIDGAMATAPSPDPLKKGYALVRWSREEDGAQAYDFNAPVTESFTLFAVWEPAESVGFVLVYYSASYSVAQSVEKRTWRQRNSVKVTDEAHTYPVGYQLSAEQIEAAAAAHLSQADNYSRGMHYFVRKDVPQQLTPLNAEGTTVINVYYAPWLFTLEFDMKDDNAPGTYALIKKKGTEYNESNRYSFPASYSMYLYNTSTYWWPQADEIFHPDGKVVIGWRINGITYEDGATVPKAWEPPNQGKEAFYQPIEKVIVTPVWGKTPEYIFMHYFYYTEIAYSDLKKAQESGSPDILELEHNDYPKYLKVETSESTSYYSSLPELCYSGYVKRDAYPPSVAREVYWTDPKTGESKVDVYGLISTPVFSMAFNPGLGRFPDDEMIVIWRKYQYPIMLEQNLVDRYELPVPTPQRDYTFVSWHTDSSLSESSKIDELTIKAWSNNQMAYAKYERIILDVFFYEGLADAEGDSQGDRAIKKVRVPSGNSMSQVGLSLPDGYTEGVSMAGKGKFTGWYFYIGDTLARFTTDSVPLSSCNVFAQYEPEAYTVTFQYDVGEFVAARTVWSDPTNSGKNTLAQGGGTNRKLPAVEVPDGYLLGWYTLPNGEGARYTATTQVDGDMKVYGFFDRVVTVRYESGKGGINLTRSSETIPAKTGTALGASVEAASGYEFDGWFCEGEKVGSALDFYPPRNDDVYEDGKTYIAKFKAVISYRSVDTAMGTVTVDQEWVDPDGTAMGAQAVPEDNCDFEYWINSKGEQVGDVPELTPPSVPETYTAIFSEEHYALIQYKVVSEGGKVDPAAELVLIDDGKAVGSTATPGPGYQFDGWANEPGDVIMHHDQTIIPTKAGDRWDKIVTYYAHFSEADAVRIDYAATAGGSVSPEWESKKPLSESPEGSTPTEEPGYRFTKWTKDAQGHTDALPVADAAANKFIPAKEDVDDTMVLVGRKYYAHFEEETVTITYAVGSNVNGRIDNAEDEILAVSADPSFLKGSRATADAGYRFIGWALDEDGEDMVDENWVDSDDHLIPQRETVKRNGKDYKVYVGRTYYAIFSTNVYRVTYMNHSGVDITSKLPEAYGEAKTYTNGVELPIPTADPYVREGYAFDGWYDALEGGNKVTSIGATETGDKTLYARWTVENYTLSFDYQGADGGNTESSRGVTVGVSYGALPRPWRTGYGFAGWYTAANGAGVQYLDNGIYLVADNLTLYANWSLSSYTITFDYQGATGGNSEVSRSVSYGANYGALPKPTRTGYEFAGWFTAANGAGARFGDGGTYQATGDTTLYANWKAGMYDINYISHTGGNITGALPSAYAWAKTYEYGVGVSIPSAEPYVNANHTFLGWYDAASGGNRVTAIGSDEAGDVTLYARWSTKATPSPTPTRSPGATATPTPTPVTTPTPTSSPSPSPTPVTDPEDPYIVVPVKPTTPPVAIGDELYEVGDYAVPLGGIGGRNVGDCPN